MSYDGTKLLTDSDLLGTYRIKDGDKVSSQFIGLFREIAFVYCRSVALI